jgi:predicted nuclease of predicted toxin-antitoxin system
MSPRLLLNENFPAPSVELLRDTGLDVLAIAEICAGMDDVDVLALAVQEQRWVITFDWDYGELLFARHYPAPPAVILLRVESYRPEEPAEWIMELVRNEQEHLGKFTVFNGSTSRSRPLLREVENENS